jgi:hypothetical protein
LWLSVSNQSQSDSATILTVSTNENERNFTLGQNSNGLFLKTRTTETDLSGKPGYEYTTKLSTEVIYHFIYTRNKNGEINLYFNGIKSDSTKHSGDLTNWNSDYKLALDNDFNTDRPWFGNIYHLAIYNRELSSEEVKHNYYLGEDGITSVENLIDNLPNNFELLQNYPNPFNPSTTIGFVLPEAANIEIFIHNILGEEIYKTGVKKYSAGKNYITFDANNFASGVYIYSIRATTNDNENYFTSRKMILTK